MRGLTAVPISPRPYAPVTVALTLFRRPATQRRAAVTAPGCAVFVAAPASAVGRARAGWCSVGRLVTGGLLVE